MTVFTHSISTNNYGPNKFVVSSSAANGTHTTIASAVTAASSGDTIFIRDGTYTENISLTKNLTFAAYSGSNSVSNVVIVGKWSSSSAITVLFKSLSFKTNSDNVFGITGSSATKFLCDNCDFESAGNDIFSQASSNSGSVIRCNYCTGDITSGSAKYFAMSGGRIEFHKCQFQNTIASTTASTASAGVFVSQYSIFRQPITSSSTGVLQIYYTLIDMSGENTTCITHGGSASNNFLMFCEFRSGSASAVSISSSLTMSNCTIYSTNTNAITGAGTILYTNLSFTSSAGINTTTQTYISTTSKTTRFTGSTTWTKDARTKSARIIGWGGGGGGGSGRARGDSVVRGGGSGGTCQGMFSIFVDASMLGSTETVTIGDGGNGGTGVGAASDGNNGTNGGVTSFGNINTWSTAVNSRGTGGTSTDVTGGTAPYVINEITAVLLPGTGGTGSASSTGTAGTSAPTAAGVGQCFWGGAAGGGGGMTSGAVASNGAAGGSLSTWAAAPTVILAGGTAGTVSGTQGGDGNNASTVTSGGIFMTGSGGGGSRSTVGSSGRGGDGGIPGGGGGGSGGGTSSSGRGGNGARGEILIIEYF